MAHYLNSSYGITLIIVVIMLIIILYSYSYSYFGGRAKKSPVVLRPPHAGRWHVVIDLGGRRGTVRASVRTI